MLTITTPLHCRPESEYALHVLLGKFLGVTFQGRTGDEAATVLEHEGRRLALPSLFFEALERRQAEALFREKKALPLWDSRQSG